MAINKAVYGDDPTVKLNEIIDDINGISYTTEVIGKDIVEKYNNGVIKIYGRIERQSSANGYFSARTPVSLLSGTTKNVTSNPANYSSRGHVVNVYMSDDETTLIEGVFMNNGSPVANANIVVNYTLTSLWKAFEPLVSGGGG